VPGKLAGTMNRKARGATFANARSWNSSNRKYKATITVNGRQMHLGSSDTAEEAAQHYARAYLSK